MVFVIKENQKSRQSEIQESLLLILFDQNHGITSHHNSTQLNKDYNATDANPIFDEFIIYFMKSTKKK
jgi:hypothetical protein